MIPPKRFDIFSPCDCGMLRRSKARSDFSLKIVFKVARVMDVASSNNTDFSLNTKLQTNFYAPLFPPPAINIHIHINFDINFDIDIIIDINIDINIGT